MSVSIRIISACFHEYTIDILSIVHGFRSTGIDDYEKIITNLVPYFTEDVGVCLDNFFIGVWIKVSSPKTGSMVIKFIKHYSIIKTAACKSTNTLC